MEKMCVEESFPKVLYDNVPFVSDFLFLQTKGIHIDKTLIFQIINDDIDSK